MKTEISKDAELNALIELWKQHTEVQQHFNEISIKVRNFAVLVISALITGIALTLFQNVVISIFGAKVSAAFFLSITGMFVVQVVHFMDTYWYHIFLKSAVAQTLEIEKKIKSIIKFNSLSENISSASQNVKVYSLFFGLIFIPKGVSSNQSLYHLRKKPRKTKHVFKILKLLRFFTKLLTSQRTVDSTRRHAIVYRGLLSIMAFIAVTSLFIKPINPTEAVNSSNRLVVNELKAYKSVTGKSKTIKKLRSGQYFSIIGNNFNEWTPIMVESGPQNVFLVRTADIEKSTIEIKDF